MASLTRLLILEDSELLRKMSSLAFPRRDYQLHEAENGLKALAVLARTVEPFDAIILDLRMPDMNGVEFLRALRRQALHRDTPVVVATSERDDPQLLEEVRDRQEALEAPRARRHGATGDRAQSAGRPTRMTGRLEIRCRGGLMCE
jgi:CheY-like chemotaxis protein